MLIETEGTASTPAIRRKFTWGLDLAGLSGQVNSMESAGGIGGLLGVLDTLGTTSTSDDYKYTYFHDGNGNVTQLVDRTQTTLASALKANYEYDAYGNTTFEGGSYAATNRWRFSTKVFDAETGMGYWGYRYYLPWTGRWGSRDPIEEESWRYMEFLRTPSNRYDGRLDVSADGGIYASTPYYLNHKLSADQPHVAVYSGNNPVDNVDPHGLRYDFCVQESQRCTSSVKRWIGLSRVTICVQRRCAWRCYCPGPDSCYMRPCRDTGCEQNHGVAVTRTFGPEMFNGVFAFAPLCADRMNLVVSQGICNHQDCDEAW